MHYGSVIFTASLFLAATTVAAPQSLTEPTETDINGSPQAQLDLSAPTVDVESHGDKWTIRCLRRTCNYYDTKCEWFFYIDTGYHEPTECHFFVKGHPASQTDTQGHNCGHFTVSSGWSGQFGPGEGFTVLSVVHQAKKLIAWPGYTDKQLESSKTVTPDLEFPVSHLPGN